MQTTDGIKDRPKETETGPIPEDWTVARLGSVTKSDRTMINPQANKNEFFEYYSIPAYHSFGKPVLEKGSRIRSQKVAVNNGTVLFAKLNPRLPKIWLVHSDSNRRKIASSEFVPLSPDQNKITSQFLFYLVSSGYVSGRAKALVSGSTPSRQRVDTPSFLDIIVPVPPISEQRSIALILSRIQRAVEQQDKIVEATRNLRKSLTKKLFTEGIGHTEFEDSEIGQIPKSWDLVVFGDSISEKDFRVGKIKQKDYKGVGKYPVVDQGRDLIAGYTDEEGKVYTGDLPTIVFGDHTRAFKFVDFPFVCGADGTKVLPPNKSKFDPLFLYYAFLNLEIPSRGYNRHYHLLKEKRIPLPPITEQREISRALNTVDSKIETEEKRKGVLQQLLKTMLHKLMTGEIRTKDLDLGVYDAS
jgi:type I restriction enzyme S subunit